MSSTVVGNLSVELGISDDQLRSGLAQAVVAAQSAGQQIKQSMNQSYGQDVESNMQALASKFRQMQQQQASDANKARSQALLNIGRSVQDFAAAGLMGVVNNVEGVAGSVAKAMGKSSDSAAAFAGKLTLIAVAAQVGLPLVKNLIEAIGSSLGLVSKQAELASTSVRGLSGGGMGGAAIAEGKKAEADFLLKRDDTPTAFNYLSRVTGTMADGAEALARNMDRAVRATALVSEAMELAARAGRDQRFLQRGSTAEFDKTTSRMERESDNKRFFQDVIDQLGGGQNLRTRIETAARNQGINKTDARMLYGAFAEGDIGATEQVTQMLGLQGQLAKFLADDWERVTGQAAELSRIEEESQKAAQVRAAENAKAIDENMARLGKEFRQRIALQEKAQGITATIDNLQLQRQRTEIIGASDVFQRNFMAGTSEDPTVKAIEKQTEDLREIMQQIKELN
jgi:hypothetical protein